MLDELRLMAIFARTLELGSFRKAANELNLSPSVVSHHVAQLEKRLGVTLLYRSTRKLSATSEGKKLFGAAKMMIHVAVEGLESMTLYSSEPVGSLHLSVPSILARSFLVEDIAAFSKQFPKVKLMINFSDEKKDLIRDGFDLAVRIGDLDDSSMKSRKLFRIERKLIASAKIYEYRMPIKKPEDLQDQKWIGLRMLPNHRILIHRDGSKYKLEFNPSILVDSVDAACQLAKAGAGFATPPSFLIEQELQSNTLIEPLPNWSLQPLDTYILWHPNASETGLSVRFKNFLLGRQKLRTSK
jgi:DNA-binding transcriptional LysR family regulator